MAQATLFAHMATPAASELQLLHLGWCINWDNMSHWDKELLRFQWHNTKEVDFSFMYNKPRAGDSQTRAPSSCDRTVPWGPWDLDFSLWNGKKHMQEHTVAWLPWSESDILCFIPLVEPSHVTHLDARGARKCGAWLTVTFWWWLFYWLGKHQHVVGLCNWTTNGHAHSN